MFSQIDGTINVFNTVRLDWDLIWKQSYIGLCKKIDIHISIVYEIMLDYYTYVKILFFRSFSMKN